MKTNGKKSFLSRIPGWALSLLAAIFSFIFLFLIAALFNSFSFFRNIGDGPAYIAYDILIAVICFFICRKDPKGFWYVPILCNVLGIISAVIEPNFWITSLWIFIGIGWVLSVIGAITGTWAGRNTVPRVKQ